MHQRFLCRHLVGKLTEAVIDNLGRRWHRNDGELTWFRNRANHRLIAIFSRGHTDLNSPCLSNQLGFQRVFFCFLASYMRRRIEVAAILSRGFLSCTCLGFFQILLDRLDWHSLVLAFHVSPDKRVILGATFIIQNPICMSVLLSISLSWRIGTKDAVFVSRHRYFTPSRVRRVDRAAAATDG